MEGEILRKVGIVICSRVQSSRIPGKAFAEINGRPLLEHLIRRILPSGHHIYLAVPDEDLAQYRELVARLPENSVTIHAGYANNPLGRMAMVSMIHSLDVVVRITHDKVFVDPNMIRELVDTFLDQEDLEYLYSSTFTPGTGFEVISARAICEAADRFKNVEHISYAIHCVTKRKWNLVLAPTSSHRLLIDYPNDLTLVRDIITELGDSCSVSDVLKHLDANPGLDAINRLPKVTVYTCAYNAAQWIRQCIESVSMQTFRDFEYLLFDDASTDDTWKIIEEYERNWSRISALRTPENIGLASGSNRCLSQARGELIVRLDADDTFSHATSLEHLVGAIEVSKCDAVYPAHYLGETMAVPKKIVRGYENHHIGGAIFRTRAINHVKFTDGLRGYEGYDFFARAKSQIKIGYLHAPVFFYRQHAGSMSKTNTEERAEIKKEIDRRVGKGN